MPRTSTPLKTTPIITTKSTPIVIIPKFTPTLSKASSTSLTPSTGLVTPSTIIKKSDSSTIAPIKLDFKTPDKTSLLKLLTTPGRMSASRLRLEEERKILESKIDDIERRSELRSRKSKSELKSRPVIIKEIDKEIKKRPEIIDEEKIKKIKDEEEKYKKEEEEFKKKTPIKEEIKKSEEFKKNENDILNTFDINYLINLSEIKNASEFRLNKTEFLNLQKVIVDRINEINILIDKLFNAIDNCFNLDELFIITQDTIYKNNKEILEKQYEDRKNFIVELKKDFQTRLNNCNTYEDLNKLKNEQIFLQNQEEFIKTLNYIEYYLYIDKINDLQKLTILKNDEKNTSYIYIIESKIDKVMNQINDLELEIDAVSTN